MRTQSFSRVVRYGLQNYIRNGWLSLATTLMLTLTLFIVSVFMLQTYVIKIETQSLREKLDMALYLDDTPSEEQVAGLIKEIKAYPEIKEAVYLNKQQVIAEWNRTQANQKIKDLVNPENNPLPRTIKVRAHDPDQLGSIADKVTKSSLSGNIRKVSYQDNRTVIKQLSDRAKKTVRNGIIVSSIFIVIVILFIYNTIRLIIQFRQEEIAIMKLVGATDSFIQGPFIIEGALYGLLAGIVTLPALYFFLKNGLQESNNLITTTDVLVTNQLLSLFKAHMAQIGATLIAAGILLAILCSWISVRRHLKR
jgi:cell division transport system permease protein